MEKAKRTPKNRYVSPTVITYGDVRRLTRSSINTWSLDALGFAPNSNS